MSPSRTKPPQNRSIADLHALRFIDGDIDIEYKTPKGWLKHNELILGTDMSVLHDGGIPVADDIFRKLAEWLFVVKKDL